MATKQNVGRHCALVTKKPDGVLGCMRRSVASRWRKVVYLALARPHGEYSAQFWVAHYKREMELLERVWQKTTKVIKGAEHVSVL